jgi:hypothetical protein
MHQLNPDYLPEISGTFERYLVNLRGEADGMMLTDGTEVHFPPHMSDEVCTRIRVGEKTEVKVRGVRQPAGGVFAAVAIETIDGACIVDNGPPADDERRKAAREQMHGVRNPIEIRGVVRRLLHGPKGEVRGLLLDDGRSGRFPPQDTAYLVQLWLTGASVILRGDEIVTDHGAVVAVREIGTSRDNMRCLDGEPKKRAAFGGSKANSAHLS